MDEWYPGGKDRYQSYTQGITLNASSTQHKPQVAYMVVSHEFTNIRGGAVGLVEEMRNALRDKERAHDIRRRLQLTLAHDAYVGRILAEKSGPPGK